MLKTIGINVIKLGDKDLVTLWAKILICSFGAFKESGIGRAKKCLAELIVEHPEIQKVDGVLRLVDYLNTDYEKKKKANKNKDKVKVILKQNKRMRKSEGLYQKENDESFNDSVDKLISKTNKRC